MSANVRTAVLFALLLVAGVAAAEPQTLRLWPGKAPGSEAWQLPETVTTTPAGERIVTNVSEPTLTLYLPEPARATGTAVVVAPGGALRLLALDNEGVKVAEWLNGLGIAAFVLKYRTLQMAQSPGPPPAPPAGAAPRQELDIRKANANP